LYIATVICAVASYFICVCNRYATALAPPEEEKKSEEAKKDEESGAKKDQ
jgi:hypothetical protein